jgi:Tfp pilus assembly protein PilV
MLRLLSQRLRPAEPATRDAGLSIVEVIVALMVFALITTGSILAVGTVLGMTADNRSRVVAANLASQAIDRARGADDLFKVVDSSTTQKVDGTSYTVARSTSWITTGGVDSQCSTPGPKGNGSLFYKRVNVTVTWSGRRPTTTPVRADTVIAPAGKISDPSTGTVLVSVLDQDGAGSPDVTVTIAPAVLAGNTAVALTAESTPDPTDSDGCAFATKVRPGTYTVTLSRADGKPFRDREQAAAPVKTVSVDAGDTASAPFSFALGDDYRATYAPNFTGQPLLPTNLSTTWLAGDGSRYVASQRVADQYLFPTSTGYTVFAGTYAPTGADGGSCLSPDPESWPKTADGKAGHRQAVAVPDPLSSKTAAAPVPMGVVTINVPATDRAVRATTTVPANGDPGCAKGQSLDFVRTPGSTTATIALPYGTWFIKSGSSATNLTTSPSIGSVIGGVLGVLVPGPAATNIVTIDPRTAP